MSWSATVAASSAPPRTLLRGRTLTWLLVVAVVAVGGFEALWFGVVTGTGLAGTDPGVVAWLAARRTRGLTTTAQLTDAWSPVVIVALIVIMLGWWAWIRAWRTVVLGGVGLGAVVVVDVATKALVARPRPPQSLHAVIATGYSLPSGHATLSAGGVLLVAWLTYRRNKWPTQVLTQAAVGSVVVFVLVAVGASGVLLGVHFPSDVLAGWALALLVVCALAGGDLLLTHRDEYQPQSDHGALGGRQARTDRSSRPTVGGRAAASRSGVW